MRTTITLDDDLFAALHQVAAEKGRTSTDVLNATLLAGLRPPGEPGAVHRMPTTRIGLRSELDLDRALRLASDLEDDAIVRKPQLRTWS